MSAICPMCGGRMHEFAWDADGNCTAVICRDCGLTMDVEPGGGPEGAD